MKKLAERQDNEAPLYNEEILALVESHGKGERLPEWDASAQEVGALCGSRIILDVAWENGSETRKIAEIGYQVEACALGTASAAIFASGAIGKTQKDVENLSIQMKKMLKGEPFCYKALQDWQKFSLLQAARLHKSRHDAILLPITAILKAFTGEDNEPI